MSAFFPFRTAANPFVIKYNVVVRGNGAVYEGHSILEADRRFAIFVAQSKIEADKSEPDTVTLFKNYEIVRHWYRSPEF
jgi:hypothetical protein